MNFKDEAYKKKIINKFEHPVRIAELAPIDILKRIRLKSDDIFDDISAGTDIFTFLAVNKRTVLFTPSKTRKICKNFDCISLRKEA